MFLTSSEMEFAMIDLSVLQLGRLILVLDYMAESRKWDIQGELKIAGMLTQQHFQFKTFPEPEGYPVQVFYADTVSVGFQSALVRTERGCTRRYDSTKVDQWVYVPFLRGPADSAVHVPCALHVEQLLLVEADAESRAALGWSEWAGGAKIATGTLYECDAVSNQLIGLVDDFNDDPDKAAIRLPTLLRLVEGSGYPWAVHIKQIACPLCLLGRRTIENAAAKLIFATIRKTGHHG